MRVNFISWVMVVALLGVHVSRAQTPLLSQPDPRTPPPFADQTQSHSIPTNETTAFLINPDNPLETVEMTQVSQNPADTLRTLEKMEQEAAVRNNAADVHISETPHILDSVPREFTIAAAKQMVRSWREQNIDRIMGTVIRIGIATAVTYVGFAFAPVTYRMQTIATEVGLAALGATVFGYFYKELQAYAMVRTYPGQKLLDRVRNFSSEWLWKRLFLYSGIYNVLFVALPYALESSLKFNGVDYTIEVLRNSAGTVLVLGLIENAVSMIKEQMLKENPLSVQKLDNLQSAMGLYISAAMGFALVANTLKLDLKDLMNGTLMASGIILQVGARTSFIENVKASVRKLLKLRPPTCQDVFQRPSA